MSKARTRSGKAFLFEPAMARLEQIVKDLESGKQSLEESLAEFEEGVKLVRDCRSYLETAKQRVEVLVGETAAGQPLIEPFEEDVDEDEEGEEEDGG